MQKTTVLVVDDEHANLETFGRVFRRDFQMTFASSGAEALAHLRRQSFDVVLTDYAMPGMTGVELLQQAADAHPTMARLLVTAHAGLAEVRASVANGMAVSIIAKPWQKEQVLQWVATAIRMAQMRASVQTLNTAIKR